MIRNKKKTPGRPKKEFISRRPQSHKEWPGRPRKHEPKIKSATIPTEVATYVGQSVDESKKKDIIILVLFLLSFILFVFSLYFTFTKDRRAEKLNTAATGEMTNISKGNIDYTTPDATIPVQETQEITGADQETATTSQPAVPTAIQPLNPQQQTIVEFYQAVNAIDITTIYTMADANLEKSNVFKTYYSRSRLTKFSNVIAQPKVVVTNIQEQPNTTNNPDIIRFAYTLEYMLANSQQRFTEERSTVLIKRNDNRRIGKLVCETKWCSTMPFFNPDKYK